MNYAHNIKRFLISSPFTCDNLHKEDPNQYLKSMEDSIPLVLPKISGVKSLNGKSVNSEHSQKVLVSENELPIHRDEEEIMEVIKKAVSTVSPDKILPPPASTAGATHGGAEDEEIAANQLQESEQQPQPSTSTLHWQNQHPGQLESMPEGEILMTKGDRKDKRLKALQADRYMVLSTTKKSLDRVDCASESYHKYKQMMVPSDKSLRKDGDYIHQPLTEDLLLHHTQMEKLKVS